MFNLIYSMLFRNKRFKIRVSNLFDGKMKNKIHQKTEMSSEFALTFNAK